MLNHLQRQNIKKKSYVFYQIEIIITAIYTNSHWFDRVQQICVSLSFHRIYNTIIQYCIQSSVRFIWNSMLIFPKIIFNRTDITTLYLKYSNKKTVITVDLLVIHRRSPLSYQIPSLYRIYDAKNHYVASTLRCGYIWYDIIR